MSDPSAEFDLSDDVLYLNHAGVSPWPRRTVDAVQRFARENGKLGAARYPQWLEVESRLRSHLAQLVGAPSAADIAFAKSTSEALSIIAYGLEWHAGDNVVGIRQEFPSNRIVWESLADLGVSYRRVDLYASDAPEDDLLGLCDARTRVVAVSSVQYARGLRLDLERLGSHCRSAGILLCVDGIQSLGAVPFDLHKVQADFVAADAHKWMLGPEAIALLYVSPEIRPRLRLYQYGWHMVQDRGDYDRDDWSPATDATRFECGSPNMLGIYGFEASLSLLLEVGIESVCAAITERVSRLIELIDKHGFELLSPRATERRAGIVTFRVPGIDSRALHKALATQGLICAPRGDGIRFSPHFYTPEAVLEKALSMTAATAARL